MRRSQGRFQSHNRWRSSVVAVPVLVMLAAGCGGTSTPTSSSNGSPILIGQVASLTGAYQTLGLNDKLGAQQAVDEINKAGGVNGHPLKIVSVEDDQTKPDQAIIAFNNLITDGAVAVVGSSFSNASLAIIKGDLDRKKIPYVSTAASDQQIDPIHAYAFMTPPTAATVAERLLQYMKSAGLTHMAVIHDTQNAFADAGWTAMKAKASQYGISFDEEETFETTSTDFSPQLSHVKAHSGIQGLMCWGTGPAPVALTKQFAAGGLKIPLLMSHAEASSLYTKPAGDAATGVIVATSLGVAGPYLPDKSPAKKVVDEMATTFQANNNLYPPQFAFDGYIAVKLIADAIRRKGSKPDQIQAGLESLTLLTPEGTYRYSKTNHWGLGLDAVVITQVQGGNFVPTQFSQNLLAQGK
jgi:branched-chain amino acid transport system substrate-binding protein